MSPPLAPSARRVQAAITAAGLKLRVVELPASTRTAAEAAAAIGCRVVEIVKTLVFRRTDDDTPRLVLAAGTNRVDRARIRAWAGGDVALAEPAFVRAATGYAIGGVAPVGHPSPIATLIDEDLLALGEVWAAAGTPNAVFALRPHQLVTLTGGAVGPVKA